MSLSVLLLSGYDAASHRYWRRGLSRLFPEYQWTQLALPDRHFYWRIRGNALHFATGYSKELSRHYDLIIATSMVDLNNLIGFFPHLGRIPSLLYFHENQFCFPNKKDQKQLIHIQLVSVFSAITADRLVFNSAFNRNTFLQGVEQLVSKLPDGLPRDLTSQLNDKSCIIPVALDQDVTALSRQLELEDNGEANVDTPGKMAEESPIIVWNHRWEHDKNPGVFYYALQQLRDMGVTFRLQLLGQQFRNHPPVFDEILQSFADHIEFSGYQPRETYLQILANAQIVVSTAWHEFQGISMQEAMALGCQPVAPNDLVYPEYIPLDCCYTRPHLHPGESANTRCSERELRAEATELAAMLQQRLLAANRPAKIPVSDKIRECFPDKVIDCYDNLLTELVDTSGKPSAC